MLENNNYLMFTRKARLAVQKCSVMGTNREGLSIAGLPSLQHLWRKIWYKETLQKNDSTYLPDRTACRTFSHRFILSCHHVSLVWPHTAEVSLILLHYELTMTQHTASKSLTWNYHTEHEFHSWSPVLTWEWKAKATLSHTKKQLLTQKRLLWKLRALAFFQKFCSWKNVC